MPRVTERGGETLDARIVRFRSRSDAESAAGLARDLISAGRFGDAASVAEVWASETPEHYEAYALVAECRKLDGDVASAQRVWLDIARRFPERPEAYAELADLLLERGEVDRARKIVERGLELSREKAPIEERLARIELIEMRRARASQNPARPSASPPVPEPSMAPTPVPPPPTTAKTLPPPAAYSPDESEIDAELDVDSTIVANRAQIEALRSLGAMLPGAPSAKDPNAEDREKSGLGLIGTGFGQEVSVVRERSDHTMPYPTGYQVAGADDIATAWPKATPPPAFVPKSTPAPASASAPAPAPASASASASASAPAPAPASASPRGSASVRPPTAPSVSPSLRATPSTPPPRDRISDRGPRPAGSKGRLVVAVTGLIGVGGLVGFGIHRYVESRNVSELASIDSALLAADPARASISIHDSSAVRTALRTAHRDIALESMLLDAAEVGGVDDRVLGAAILRARARNLPRETVALAQSIRAYGSEGVDAADRALPATLVDAPATLALVHARMSIAVGRRRTGKAALDVLARSSADSIGVALALAEFDRSNGDDASARRRVELVLRSNPAHRRASLILASIELDANTPIEPATKRTIEAGQRSLGRGDRILTMSILVRDAVAHGSSPRIDELTSSIHETERLAPATEIEVAAALLASGRSAEAIRRIVASFGDAPTDRRARRTLARAFAARGASAEVLRLVGDDPASLELRAEAACTGPAEPARRVASEIAALGSAASPRLRALSLRLRVVGGESLESVLAEAQASLSADPTDRDTLLAVLGLAASEGRWDLIASSVGASHGDDPVLVAWLALAAFHRLATDDLKSASETLSRIAPDTDDAIAFTSYAHLSRGELEPAAAGFGRLVQSTGSSVLGSTRVVGLSGIILVALERGATDTARDAAAELDETDRERPEARVALARLALAGGRAADAVALLQARAGAARPTLDVQLALADALLAMNSVDRATSLYREVLEAAPAQVDASLGVAEILFRADHTVEANAQLTRVRRLLDTTPRGPTSEARYLTLLGRVLLAKPDVEQARFVLRRAIQTGAAPASAHFFLGESLAGVNSPESRAAYERYLSLQPTGEFASRATRAIR